VLPFATLCTLVLSTWRCTTLMACEKRGMLDETSVSIGLQEGRFARATTITRVKSKARASRY
jgi:hypothetical protein